MRVPIPHQLGKDEARRRLQNSGGELGRMIPGGLAKVTTDWPDADHMEIAVRAMGEAVTATAAIEENAVILTMNLPPALSFFAPAIERAVADKGRKLLT